MDIVSAYIVRGDHLSTNDGLRLAQRRRRWANLKPLLVQHLVLVRLCARTPSQAVLYQDTHKAGEQTRRQQSTMFIRPIVAEMLTFHNLLWKSKISTVTRFHGTLAPVVWWLETELGHLLMTWKRSIHAVSQTVADYLSWSHQPHSATWPGRRRRPPQSTHSLVLFMRIHCAKIHIREYHRRMWRYLQRCSYQVIVGTATLHTHWVLHVFLLIHNTKWQVFIACTILPCQPGMTMTKTCVSCRQWHRHGDTGEQHTHHACQKK